MSFWNRPTEAAKNAVVAPMKVTKVSAVGASSNIGEQRQTRNTPAVTMVAAWISAETGVGPSIASGSQVCRPNLRRLAHRADEQQQAERGQDIDVVAGEEERLADHRRGGGEHRVEIQRA